MHKLSTRFIAALLLLVLGLIATPLAQDKPENVVVGHWSGDVDTDRGQMAIKLDIAKTGAAFTGAIESPHGKWTIEGGTFEKGQWRLPFKGGEGNGFMMGSIVKGRFTGEWNNTGVAKGTFDLGRVKP